VIDYIKAALKFLTKNCSKMKKLIFVRHGRAEESSPLLSDFERSLTMKGKTVTQIMALKMKDKEKDLGVIISSPAFRALETAIIFAREFEIDPEEIIMRSNIYFKLNLNTLSVILSEISDDINTITLFGHNPSFTEIPDRLSKSGCDFLPKSSVVCLSFKSASWQGVMHEKGKQEYFLKPDKSL